MTDYKTPHSGEALDLHIRNFFTGHAITKRTLLAGPIEVDGKFYRVPRILQNLEPELLVPYIDPINGKRVYFYKLTRDLFDTLKKTRRADNAWRQMIPRLGDALVDELPQPLYASLQKQRFEQSFISGPWLRIPPELVYVINYRSRNGHLFPKPTLVPIFSARKRAFACMISMTRV